MTESADRRLVNFEQMLMLMMATDQVTKPTTQKVLRMVPRNESSGDSQKAKQGKKGTASPSLESPIVDFRTGIGISDSEIDGQ